MFNDTCTATGCLVAMIPEDSPERDELLGLLRIGITFSKNHVGKRTGFLRRYLEGVVAGITGEVSFARLIDRLENSINEPGSPIEEVNRRFEFMVYRNPRNGKKEVVFRTLENILTAIKNS